MKVKPIESLEEGMDHVANFVGKPEEFELAIPESLLDPLGINMSLITDRVLGRGWQPDGFTQGNGFRLYRYKELS